MSAWRRGPRAACGAHGAARTARAPLARGARGPYALVLRPRRVRAHGGRLLGHRTRRFGVQLRLRDALLAHVGADGLGRVRFVRPARAEQLPLLELLRVVVVIVRHVPERRLVRILSRGQPAVHMRVRRLPVEKSAQTRTNILVPAPPILRLRVALRLVLPLLGRVVVRRLRAARDSLETQQQLRALGRVARAGESVEPCLARRRRVGVVAAPLGAAFAQRVRKRRLDVLQLCAQAGQPELRLAQDPRARKAIDVREHVLRRRGLVGLGEPARLRVERRLELALVHVLLVAIVVLQMPERRLVALNVRREVFGHRCAREADAIVEGAPDARADVRA